MRIYLSGAISGTNDYMERFAKVEKMVREEYPKAEVLNPAKVNSNLPKDFTHKEYMEISFLEIDFCDAVYLMEGWQNSKGACMEYGYALGKDKIILSLKSSENGR